MSSVAPPEVHDPAECKVPESLIKHYLGGSVVPIIGCEMLMINQPANNAINIHDYIISRQFEPTDECPLPPDNFYDLDLTHDFHRNDIRSILATIPEKSKDLSLLSRLAGMQKLRTFIIASMFKDFEAVLTDRKENFEAFKNDSNNSSKLNNLDFSNNKRNLIYLFDREDMPEFAINEEQRLEYLFSLARTHNIETSLLNHLTGKTLLFIGCDFSDWFMRYCIRVLYNSPYEKKPSVYIINNNSKPPKFRHEFFRKHQIPLIHQFPVKKFIEEFYNRAMEKQEFIDLFEGQKAFICYSHHDSKAAQKINDCLNFRGLGTWFDEHDKKAGPHVDAIQLQIMDAAKTKVMVCIISAKLMEEVKNNQSSYVRDIEWDVAETRIKAAKMRNVADRFAIIPYFVDDPRPYLNELPSFISSQFRFNDHEEGCDDLFDTIKTYLK